MVLRKSKQSKWIPHFLWVKDLRDAELMHYVPSKHESGWRAVLDCINFEGEIKTTDKKEQSNE